MVNEAFEPSERQDQLLEVIKEGRGEGEPWGRATTSMFVDRTGIRKQYVAREATSLVDAGWFRKPYPGLYEFVCDPREELVDDE